jgi:serine/threonine protein kinase/Tol biopolymer transport system component
MTIAAGSKLGPYEILTPIGAGGMGEVWKARDTRLGRVVAIKVLPAHLSTNTEVRARFEREARAISQLSHPHICALYDIGQQDSIDYLVMEYLEGETLAARLAKGPPPTADVLRYGSEIANALDCAHRSGIVHRDLKPGNIMLTKSGAKLMDFGLARAIALPAVTGALSESPTASSPLTAKGTIVGTFQYMAPEQLEGKETDARTDLWALGCVLYEMATGKRAFEGTSQASLIAAILKEEPRPVSELQPLTPPALEHLVKRCLAKDAAERWQSARDVMHELKWFAEGGSQAGVPLPAAVHHTSRGRLAWLAVGLLGLALGVAITAAVMMRQAGSRIVSFTSKTFQQYPIFTGRFAPDGQSIVFSAAPEGNTPELFSVRPEYIAPRSLGLRGVHLLAVSSSGEMAVLTGAKHIAHCVFTGTLARLPLGAEVAREVLENVREADWSPDGLSLAIIRDVGGKDRLEYPIGKLLFESGGYLSDPRFSPQGDKIAFFDHPAKWDDRGSVKVVDLAGRVTELSSGYAAVEGIAWSPDGRQVYFSGTDISVGASFGSSVFAVTLSGKRRVAQESAGALMIFDVSRRGRWLVGRIDIRLGIKARPPGAKTERDLSWLDGSSEPALSAGGRTMLFTEAGGEHNVNYLVCLRGTDGSPVVQLGEGSAQQMSPDGKWALAFVPTSPMQPVLYPTGPGERVKLERGSIEAYESGAVWFPDGRRIALCGVEPGKGWRVYVQEIPSGKPQPITPEGTHLGALSPDGKLVLARSSDGSWAIFPLEGGAPRPMPGLMAREEAVRWSTDGRSVYVFNPRQVPCRVERFTLATGQRDLVMLLGTENRTGLTRVVSVSMADDPNVYAYSCYRMLSQLFAVDGAR